ncbi:MAG: hypothetical protein Ta2F_07480 [Termitinemataceae bacterium]|nr:MAG: hypothetical protein Ta2F_07480 [Termitinemataceae bacterium]
MQSRPQLFMSINMGYMSKHLKIHFLALLAVFCWFCAGNVSSLDLDIDKTELGQSQGVVEFENNPNQVKGNTTVEQIRAIGKNLAKGLRDKNGKLRQNIDIGDKDRYLLHEATDSKDDGKGLSADIIKLGSKAGVDTIKNLRHILSGYIEEAYRYPINVCDELAVYVTVYNAINRKTFDRFNEYYKKIVSTNLTPDNVGLSSSWKDWAGSTQIVIPLYDPDDDGILTIEVKEVVNKEVVAAMKKEPVKGADPEKFNPPPPRPTKEQLLEKNRKAMQSADNALRDYERALADAKQRALLERNKQKTMEEKLVTEREALSKINVTVVKNKFGDPIKGNEESKAKEIEVAALQKAVANQHRIINRADDSVVDAEKKLEAARALIEQLKLEEQQIQ